MRLILSAAAIAAGLFSAAPALAEPACLPASVALPKLQEAGYQPVGRGIVGGGAGLLVIIAKADGNVVCILGAGEGWQTLATVEPGEAS